MIYLFVRPRPGHPGPWVFDYQHHWPHLRRIIWSLE